MIVCRGEVYIDKAHIDVLRDEKEYVKRRYQAVARTLAKKPFKISRKEAAQLIGRGLRQLYRILRRFLNEGVSGLRFKSKRPKTSPNKIPEAVEKKIVSVRKSSGFGPRLIADIINESNRREGRSKKIYPSLAYNVLVRNGEIEREKRLQRKWKFFEWSRPNRLIQADLTKFNGVSIISMEDDHSRKGWALALPNANDETVIRGMKKLIKEKYDNLLTDNGSQFSRKNSEIRKYCEEFVQEKHIWSSIHHPQTLGKLSAYQKGLKCFLRHMLKDSRDLCKINHWIKVYNHWYNNGKYHTGIKTYPEEKYNGKRDNNWYEKIVKAFKLEDVLTI
ncbi:MAG: transposase [Thermoplasmatales archaeon]|nr:transposase [Thermoplasmatales archaeon]